MAAKSKLLRILKMVEYLTSRICVPCKGGVAALLIREAEELLTQTPGWELKDDAHHLYNRFEFDNFLESLSFVNKVGQLAEAEGHHPRIVTEWGNVTISWWTHKIRGLHRNDFIMAAKTDRLYE